MPSELAFSATRIAARKAVLEPHTFEEAPGFAALGVRAFTTTRAFGSFATAGREPVGAVMERWERLRIALGESGRRFATASQVHGARILIHGNDWSGWLRSDSADGHIAPMGGMALAVTVADCVPVFLAHPSGCFGVLHSGWRGTAAGIMRRGIEAFAALGWGPASMLVHIGPAICGRCYEVGPEVHAALGEGPCDGPAPVDLRAIIASQARDAGAASVTVSASCTLCDAGNRFFSHRGGDAGRQLGVIARAE